MARAGVEQGSHLAKWALGSHFGWVASQRPHYVPLHFGAVIGPEKRVGAVSKICVKTSQTEAWRMLMTQRPS
jgi:hypothetical protein